LKDPTPVIGIAQITESNIRIGIGPWVRVADVVAAEAEVYRALVQEFRVRRIDLGVAPREVRLVNA
jgi:small conductance mechanosensitive channel